MFRRFGTHSTPVEDLGYRKSMIYRLLLPEAVLWLRHESNCTGDPEPRLQKFKGCRRLQSRTMSCLHLEKFISRPAGNTTQYGTPFHGRIVSYSDPTQKRLAKPGRGNYRWGCGSTADDVGRTAGQQLVSCYCAVVCSYPTRLLVWPLQNHSSWWGPCHKRARRKTCSPGIALPQPCHARSRFHQLEVYVRDSYCKVVCVYGNFCSDANSLTINQRRKSWSLWNIYHTVKWLCPWVTYW